MSKRKEPTLINGFASVQAIKHSGKAPQAQPRLKHSATSLPQAEASASSATTPPVTKASRAGHTAIPIKHELVCYECGYGFVVSGKIHYALCPKCKRNLDIDDHTVDGPLSSDLRTMGSVTVGAQADLGTCIIIAQNIIIAANATRATLRATRRLELASGGMVNLQTATMREFTIQAGATLTLKETLVCPIIDIAGSLRANIRAEDRVRIRATATFCGELSSPRLDVEDGATIKASMCLGRAVTQAAQETKHAA
ncbi:MAG: polymer-forming cytoskeletal protein [Verrucomicrobia bacterium]|nr:polymer-forming cytoskeletal protein [Verrucomicrobiota bacterium]